MPNTSGLLSRRGIISQNDAPVVSKMKAAGAILIGLTNCSELCMWYESQNFVYGRTKNAYHRGRIVGGSSGGKKENIFLSDQNLFL
jgi:fatty acid amide hydrolase 2